VVSKEGPEVRTSAEIVSSGPANDQPAADGLRLAEAEDGPGLRWFIRRGGVVLVNKGFRTKGAASAWIDSHGYALDWRVGYLFRLRRDPRDVVIVDRSGAVARA